MNSTLSKIDASVMEIVNRAWSTDELLGCKYAVGDIAVAIDMFVQESGVDLNDANLTGFLTLCTQLQDRHLQPKTLVKETGIFKITLTEIVEDRGTRPPVDDSHDFKLLYSFCVVYLIYRRLILDPLRPPVMDIPDREHYRIAVNVTDQRAISGLFDSIAIDINSFGVRTDAEYTVKRDIDFSDGTIGYYDIKALTKMLVDEHLNATGG